MNKSVVILYKYLIHTFQAERKSWHDAYEHITKAVCTIREKLLEEDSKKINDPSLYGESLAFESWEMFLDKMFDNRPNGVSGIGQSIFSDEMRKNARHNHELINILTNLIKDPSKNNHEQFANIWNQVFSKNNPVQTNRATATCTLDVSSTVDVGRFNEVFSWFVDNKYVEPYTGGDDWYSRNIYLVKELRAKIDTTELREGELPDVPVDNYWINIFIWLAYENIANPFSLSKQVIKYGAPGTGKTYNAKKICQIQYSFWKKTYGLESEVVFDEVFNVVQFHPTYSYEDFIEGLRPILKESKSQLTLVNGIFKQLCKEAGKWEADLYNIDPNREFSEWTVEQVKQSRLEKDKEYWKYVLTLDEETKVKDILPPYFIVIDEINRAELSAVFGELMYSLEYRGASNAIKTQYAALNDASTAVLTVNGIGKFFVSHNVYIIGTMNTIDRSVDSFDFALRRRFKWEEVHPDMDLLKLHLDEYNKVWSPIVKSVTALNDKLEQEPLLGKDYRLGHAYFWNLGYNKDLKENDLRKRLWEDKIGPLLEEYLRGSGNNGLINSFKTAFGLK